MTETSSATPGGKLNVYKRNQYKDVILRHEFRRLWVLPMQCVKHKSKTSRT